MFFKMLEEPSKKRLTSLKQMANWTAIAMDTRTVAMLDVDYYDKESKLSTDMSFLTNKHPWHKSITKGNPKTLDPRPPKGASRERVMSRVWDSGLDPKLKPPQPRQ